MPPVARTCSECGNTLAGTRPGTKTCGQTCRAVRSRRIKRAGKDAADFERHNPEGAREVAAIVRRQAPDVLHRVMREELAPIVREALTEDILRSINQMVGLTPKAVELLKEDMESEDPTIRQRAYTLIMKYTIGHPALVKADDADGSKQIVVNFNLPRPDDDEGADIALVECDMCHADKPAAEFIAGSTRCAQCYAEYREKVLAQFAS